MSHNEDWETWTFQHGHRMCSVCGTEEGPMADFEDMDPHFGVTLCLACARRIVEKLEEVK